MEFEGFHILNIFCTIGKNIHSVGIDIDPSDPGALGPPEGLRPWGRLPGW